GRRGTSGRVLVVVVTEVRRASRAVGREGGVVDLDHATRPAARHREAIVVAAAIRDRQVAGLGAVRIAQLVDVVRPRRGGRVGITLTPGRGPAFLAGKEESGPAELTKGRAGLAARLAEGDTRKVGGHRGARDQVW